MSMLRKDKNGFSSVLSYVVLVVCILLLFSVNNVNAEGNQTAESVVGIWNGFLVQKGKEEAFLQSLLEIKEDGTCVITVNDATQEFSWEMKNSELFIDSKKCEFDEFDHLIVDLSYAKLTFAKESELETIQFRSIPWGTQYKYAEKYLSTESDLTEDESQFKENANLNGWDSISEFMVFDNTGVISGFSGRAAGYDVKLKLSYYYELDKTDWTVNRAYGDSKFCRAEYSFVTKQTPSEVYKDLQKKLYKLYGSFTERGDKNSLTGTLNSRGSLWKAKDGSCIYLLAKLNVLTSSIEDVTLIYSCPDLNKTLYDIEHYESLKEAEERQKEMEENQDDNSGL